MCYAHHHHDLFSKGRENPGIKNAYVIELVDVNVTFKLLALYNPSAKRTLS